LCASAFALSLSFRLTEVLTGLTASLFEFIALDPEVLFLASDSDLDVRMLGIAMDRVAVVRRRALPTELPHALPSGEAQLLGGEFVATFRGEDDLALVAVVFGALDEALGFALGHPLATTIT
jgi:hypothetical protein